ncbi:MAG: ABC transporter substrate-binding protein [Pseudonocardiaceae bacterium]
MPQSVSQLLDFLDKIVGALSKKFLWCRRLRFPHYAVAVWLVYLIGRSQVGDGIQPDQGSQRLENEFKEFIRERFRLSRREQDVHNLASDVPWWMRLAVRVLPKAGLLLMRSAWNAPRWFRRRNTGLVRTDSFTGLAQRFVDWTAESISEDAIRELVVDAFLQDLRRAYRKTSLFGAGRRRTMYPVLILRRHPGATSVTGLVELVQRCRNLRVERRSGRTTSRWDPLLIITDRPDGVVGPAVAADPKPESAANSEFAYRAWLNRLNDMAPARRDRVLPLCVPEGPEPDGLRDALLNTRIPRSVPAVTPLLLTVALVAGLITAFVVTNNRCWTPPWAPLMQRHDGASGISECVGLASPSFRFFSDLRSMYGNRIDPVLADQLRSVEESIAAANNRIAEKANHRTIVYLGVLSPTDTRPLKTELEQLRGLAVAQAESEPGKAPLRVLLANAGHGLSYANEAVDAIGLERERDPSIVGVVGLGISVDATRAALRSLADHRLPTVATQLSATDLATRTTQYFHQLGPTNEREARVAAFFAKRRLGVDSATIYYSNDPTDLYSVDLAQRSATALQLVGITAQFAPYQQSPGVGTGEPIDELGRRACELAKGRNGLAFYVGRAERLLEFLRGMKASCEGAYPKLLVGDDVNRFAVDIGFAEFPGLTVNYLSFASSLAWPGDDCEGASDNVGFYRGYLAAYHDCGATREGSAALAYDAALVFRVAIERATQDTDAPPSGDLILGKINEMVGENGVNGASGRFELTPDYANRRVSVNKAILVLKSDGGQPATEQLLCGRLDTAVPPSDPQCPRDIP